MKGSGTSSLCRLETGGVACLAVVGSPKQVGDMAMQPLFTAVTFGGEGSPCVERSIILASRCSYTPQTLNKRRTQVNQARQVTTHVPSDFDRTSTGVTPSPPYPSPPRAPCPLSLSPRHPLSFLRERRPVPTICTHQNAVAVRHR